MQHDTDDVLSDKISKLLRKREYLRRQKQFAEADKIRQELEGQGYKIIDSPHSQRLKKSETIPSRTGTAGPGKIAVFGSGEMSPTGRRIHEYLIKNITTPVNVALLETPAGFEDNPHHWYRKLSDMLAVGLQNFQPKIHRIEALRRDGTKSTNNEEILKPLTTADYIHLGAGSPSYAITHLKDSLAYRTIIERVTAGVPLSLASAAAIAVSSWALPVYEIYKVGDEPFWQEGLGLFREWDLDITIIPHWNNSEGGTDFDSSRCFMGSRRFVTLLKLLPKQTVIIGIDEQTAAIFDFGTSQVQVMGTGTVTVLKEQTERLYKSGQRLNMQELRIERRDSYAESGNF